MLTRVKIALALTGLVMFGAGVRLEHQELRWVGLGLVVAAWLLRFARARKPEDSSAESE